MHDRERMAEEKYRSRFFKRIAGWGARHGTTLAAVCLIMVSAVLGTFETKLVYADSSLSYGKDGSTSSPSYVGGTGTNPTVHEPGVIGVSVETYDLQAVGNSKLKYGYGTDKGKGGVKASNVSSTNDLKDINNAINQYGKNEGASVWTRNNEKEKGFYPYWTEVGTTKDGKSIYTYSNIIKHAITQNIVAMQTADSFDDSTLVFVPRSVASSNHLPWVMNLNQHVIGKSTKNTKKFAIFYNLNPWYDDETLQLNVGTVIGSVLRKDYYNRHVIEASESGIYYDKLKSYLRNQEKKKTGKKYLMITDQGNEYKVCNYSRFSNLKSQKDLDALIGYKKNSKGKYEFTSDGETRLKRARALYSSFANITEPYENQYLSTPENVLLFMRFTTSRGLGNDTNGTGMFSPKGHNEGIYGRSNNDGLLNEHSSLKDAVSETVMRNLFSSEETLEKCLAKNPKAKMTELKKVVLNDEYNTHYLDLLLCGYALARASGDDGASQKWYQAIRDFTETASDTSTSMKNVVIRMDTGMVYGTTTDVTFASTGDVINKHYGLGSVSEFSGDKTANSKSLNKGFIGFAANNDNTQQNYQATNQEVASKHGVVTKSSYKNYRNYYDRLENAINAQSTAVSSGKGWYGTMMAARATYKEYYRPNKNTKATSKVANKLAVVELLKVRGSSYGIDASRDSAGKSIWQYGTYAIDAYAWKSVENQDSIKFNLAIYSTKANGKAPSANGKNIKDTFQSVKVDVTGDNSTVTDDLYVKLTPDKDKDSQALFAKMLSSNKYYVKVVFEDGTGKTVKTLDGKNSKTVKEIKGGSTSQQKKYAAALNQYDDTNKGSENGDEQNYNKLVSAKQIGGKTLQTNNCLIWRISNSKVRTDGLKISAKSSKYVNWKAKVYIYKKSGSGASAIWTNVFSGTQVKGKTVKAADMGSGDYTETNNVIAQYIGKRIDPDEDEVNLSGTYESTPEAYAELKEGSVYNETFEAMAGTPSTRSLYFATGGSEFIVNMQAVYDDYNLEEVGGNKDSYRSTRTYKSIFKKVACEYKKGDQLKNLAAGRGRKTKKKKERAASSPF